MKKKFLIVTCGLLLVSTSFWPLNASADDSVVLPALGSVSGILDKISAGQGLVNATQAVPTKDTSLEAKDTGISIFGLNIGVSWNQLAINVAKTVLNQIVDSTVNWINTGFQGSPAFVSNPEAYFGGLANGIAGDLIKNSNVGFLCSPIDTNVKLSLQQYYNQPYKPQCTLTFIQGNLENFYDKFSNGGWQSFIQMTQGSNNNEYSSYIGLQVQLDRQVATALGTEQTKFNWGSGFKSQGDCLTYNGLAGDANYNSSYAPGACTKYGPIQTPGATIKSHLDAALPANSLLTQITSADQFDKILSALGNAFLQKFVFSSGGLLGKSSGSGGTGSPVGGGPPPTVVCTASPNPAVMNVTKVTWSVDSNIQNEAVSFTWGGDDNLTGAGDTISHTYATFGNMQAYVLASTTNLDDLGNYIPGTEQQNQKFPCTPLLVTQYPPLSLVSCTPSVLTTKTDAQVTWTAVISGGSGTLNSVEWSGGQSSYPGCSVTGVPGVCSIWDPIPLSPPFGPLGNYTYAFSAGVPPPPQGQTVGTTLYTGTPNPDKTTTLTATRVYFGNTGGKTGVQPGDAQDAQIKVFDAGPNVLPLTADCGSITIVP
jgi:hypothetical protein